MNSQNFNDTRTNALREAGVSEHAGFPNPATDRSLQNLDISTLLIRHSASTYLMRIQGNDWRSLGILDGDIVIVDRALDWGPNDLVVWWQGETFTISHQNQVPQNSETWGVVSATIHRFRKLHLRR
jgi:hypothetical protein